MSSQTISQIISSIKARFTKSSNRSKINRLSNQNDSIEQSNQQSESSSSSARCIVTAPSETTENSGGAQWWARLYRGLVIDSAARHYRQMGPAVWLFLYFLLNANWKTGRLYRRLSTVSQDTGINLFAIRRWLRVLQRNGYINACYNGRFWVIAINKWRPLQSLITRKRKSSLKFPASSRARN